MTATPLQSQLVRTVTIRLTDRDLERAVHRAAERGLKLPQLIRYALLEHLAQAESNRHA